VDRILVTGATGTVGRHLVPLLRAAGADVRAFVRDPARTAAVLGPDVDLAVGDLGDPASLLHGADGVRRADAVLLPAGGAEVAMIGPRTSRGSRRPRRRHVRRGGRAALDRPADVVGVAAGVHLGTVVDERITAR
jgi:uncharacterized protein YbjT (DUF2867 family)